MSSSHKAKTRQQLSGWPENNDVRYACEIKSRTAMAKAAFNKNTPLISKLHPNLQKQVVKC